MYDIIIIGAGPAGATLARLLDKNLNIMIIDKRNLADGTGLSRDKCCGGLLAPAAQKALARQGLGVPSFILESPQTFSVESVDHDNGITKYYQRHYINIDRGKFDKWLVSLMPKNIEKNFGCIYKEYTEENDGYVVYAEKKGSGLKFKTRVLIGADGADSRVRMQVFNNSPMPAKYVSIQEEYSTNEVLPYYVSVFDRDVTDFYSWIIQKNDKLLVGTAVPEKFNVNKRFKILTARLSEQGYITGKPLKRTGAMIMRPSNLRQLNIAKDNIALLGEAAGFISPSSAEGISYALESGRILAEAMNNNLSAFAGRYKKGLWRIKFNLIYKKAKVLLMYNKFSRRMIMKSGILSMKVEIE